jgi:hypothetical protein
LIFFTAPVFAFAVLDAPPPDRDELDDVFEPARFAALPGAFAVELLLFDRPFDLPLVPDEFAAIGMFPPI